MRFYEITVRRRNPEPPMTKGNFVRTGLFFNDLDINIVVKMLNKKHTALEFSFNDCGEYPYYPRLAVSFVMAGAGAEAYRKYKEKQKCSQ